MAGRHREKSIFLAMNTGYKKKICAPYSHRCTILHFISPVTPLWMAQGTPRARRTKSYDVTIDIYRNSPAKVQDSKMHNLWCMGSKLKIGCEISNVRFEIPHQILNPYTAKYAFYEVLKLLRLMISWSYDILILSETGIRCYNFWKWHVLSFQLWAIASQLRCIYVIKYRL